MATGTASLDRRLCVERVTEGSSLTSFQRFYRFGLDAAEADVGRIIQYNLSI